MSLGDIIQHLYLPLLFQETAVMTSVFTYGLKAGVSTPMLIAINTAAVITDLGIFFVPTHFLSTRLHDILVARFQENYDRAMGIVVRMGAFRTAAIVGFIMPSVAAMVVVGLLRMSFWRALSGLFVGSALYVALPLLVALPLASTLPSFIIPMLPWVSPALIVALLVLIGVRLYHAKRHSHEKLASGTEDATL